MAIATLRNNKVIETSIIRAANTTAYAAGDVVENSTASGFTFATAARGNAMGGQINHAMLFSSHSNGTPLDGELWVMDTLMALDVDNLAFTPTDAEMRNMVGVIPFATGNGFVGTAAGNVLIPASRTFLPMRFVTATADDALYGVLVARNAYVPASAEVITLKLFIEQD